MSRDSETTMGSCWKLPRRNKSTISQLNGNVMILWFIRTILWLVNSIEQQGGGGWGGAGVGWGGVGEAYQPSAFTLAQWYSPRDSVSIQNWPSTLLAITRYAEAGFGCVQTYFSVYKKSRYKLIQMGFLFCFLLWLLIIFKKYSVLAVILPSQVLILKTNKRKWTLWFINCLGITVRLYIITYGKIPVILTPRIYPSWF